MAIKSCLEKFLDENHFSIYLTADNCCYCSCGNKISDDDLAQIILYGFKITELITDIDYRSSPRIPDKIIIGYKNTYNT